MSDLQFFLPIIPPTVTAQVHKVTIRKGKPQFYQPDDLKAARAKLEAHLAKHKPVEPFVGGVQLITKWCFPRGAHTNGSYRTTKPDTDNLQKLLKDVMTRLGYWKDDAQVASEVIEKFWADVPGIFISIRKLEEGDMT